MQGAFDLKVEEYKQVKSLERENLRDHMTDIELILTRGIRGIPGQDSMD